MQRLILFRHGKAAASSDSGDDFDRPLAPRGVGEASEMGARLAGLGVRPDVALVSMAARTRQTWEAAQAAFPAATVKFDPSLYNAASSEIWRAAGEEPGAVMVVAHNPGLHELALRLMIAASAPAQDLAAAQSRFPPATAAVFAFGADGAPRFEGLHYPQRPE